VRELNEEIQAWVEAPFAISIQPGLKGRQSSPATTSSRPPMSAASRSARPGSWLFFRPEARLLHAHESAVPGRVSVPRDHGLSPLAASSPEAFQL